MISLRPEFQAIALIVAAAAIAAAVVAYASAGPRTASGTSQHNRPAASPTALPRFVAGPLDGQRTARALATRSPVVAIVDNFSPDARPQSGLSRASVVFETLIEGGVTRLEAVFLEHDASRVGPIRSARPYFVKWAAGLGGLLVHAGGSPASLQLIPRYPSVGDVDALGARPQFVRAKDRQAPYNLYTSTAGVRTVAKEEGIGAATSIPLLPHKSQAPRALRGQRQAINIDFSTSAVSSPTDYAVQYRYVPTQNKYVRYVGGQPAVDALSGATIKVSNVVALTAQVALIPNDPEGRISVGVVGHGAAEVFRDGKIVRGTWSKPSAVAPLQVRDTIGRSIALDPGPTWIEVVPVGAVRVGPAT